MAAAKNEISVEIIDESKNTNVHLFAFKGDHESLSKFKAGSKMDAPNTYGLTPLMFAARYGHLEAVKSLLTLRADSTKANKYGGSVFLMAVASGNLDIVNILLQHLLSGGVSRRAIEAHFSPISLSILFGHEHVFKFLLGSKFNVKSISLYTELTPLMFAALNENPIFTKHLMLMGADPRIRNANKETCHDLERRLYEPQPPKIQPSPHPHHPQLHIEITHQPPVVLLSPQQQYFNHLIMPRKSSNVNTPEILSPTVSPIGFYPQVFFPTDFSAAQVYQCAFSPFNQNIIMSPVFGIPSPFSHMSDGSVTEEVFFT